MCGIFGILSTSQYPRLDRKFIENCIITGQLRGTHATGLFSIPNVNIKEDSGQPYVYKRALSGGDFIWQPETIKLLEMMESSSILGLIGHHRYATMGSRDNTNAHPFTVDHITLVHNGSIARTDRLPKSVPGIDSYQVTYNMAKVGELETLQTLHGAYVLVWYNQETGLLNVARNEDRPFHFIVDDQTVLFASEGPMLLWLAKRNHFEIKDFKHPTPYVWFKFDPLKPWEYTKEEYVKETIIRVAPVVITKRDTKVISYSDAMNMQNVSAWHQEREGAGKAALKAMKLRLGYTTKFYFDTWVPFVDNDFYGVISGYVYAGSRNNSVYDAEVQGANTWSWKKMDDIKKDCDGLRYIPCKITGALPAHASANGRPVIYLELTKKLAKIPTDVLTAQRLARLREKELEDKDSAAAVANASIKDPARDITMYTGPNEKLLTQEEWHHALVGRGGMCAWCDEVAVIESAEKLHWFRDGDNTWLHVCTDCQDNPEVQLYLGWK